MSASDRRSSLQNEAFLKARVKELEQEVAGLKTRLDELRKAKNTTVIKRERETIELNPPNLGARRESKYNETGLQKRLEENDKSHQRLLEELRKAHRSEVAELNRRHEEEVQQIQNKDSKADCGHNRQIEDLKHTISDLQGDNAAILVENEDLKEKVSGLLHDLSIKEAKKCETEEDIEKKVSVKWQEMYQDWMVATEAKLAELQHANSLLRRMIDAGKPRGKDPTGQDKT